MLQYNSYNLSHMQQHSFILVVTPDHATFETFRSLLENGDRRLLHGTSGSAGLIYAQMEQVHLLVIDQRVSDMKVDEIISEFRRRPDYSGVPVLVMTDQAQSAGFIDLQSSGTYDTLSFPIEEDDVLGKVDCYEEMSLLRTQTFRPNPW